MQVFIENPIIVFCCLCLVNAQPEAKIQGFFNVKIKL